MSNDNGILTTRKAAAYNRYRTAHHRYHGGFLKDCFWDEAAEIFGNYYIAERADADDPRWDTIHPEAVADKEAR